MTSLLKYSQKRVAPKSQGTRAHAHCYATVSATPSALLQAALQGAPYPGGGHYPWLPLTD
jgi:hypothetical protein